MNDKGITTTNTYDTYEYPDSVKTENADKVTTSVNYDYNNIDLLLCQDVVGELKNSYIYENLGNVLKKQKMLGPQILE